MNLRLRWWRLWAGLVGWNWQQGHPRDAAEALREPTELKSKQRVEQNPPLLHLSLTSVQTHSQNSAGDGGSVLAQKSCHTGEGRCPSLKWVPAFAGMTGECGIEALECT